MFVADIALSDLPSDMTTKTLRNANYGGMPFTVMDNLYVPKGCKEAYKEVYPWSEFKEIIEE